MEIRRWLKVWIDEEVVVQKTTQSIKDLGLVEGKSINRGEWHLLT